MPGGGVRHRPAARRAGFQRGLVADAIGRQPAHRWSRWRVAMVRALRVVRRLRPAVVVGVGGYASAARVCWPRGCSRIPIVVHEQNAVPGLANRVAARLGARVAVSFPGTAAAPGATVVGNPVRASSPRSTRTPDVTRPARGRRREPRVAAPERRRARPLRPLADARRRPGAPRRRTASTTTSAAARLERLHRPRRRARVRAGRRTRTTWTRLYGRASLAVCRAGAVTVAELAAAGVPSVLVPWPGAADDHQTDNARVMEAGRRRGPAYPTTQCDGARLDAVDPRAAARSRRG